MSSHLRGAAIVPAAPLVLSAASPDQPAGVREDVAALRADVIAAIEALPRTDVVLLVAGGPRGFHDHALSDLRPLGLDAPPVEVPVATDLIEDLTRLTQYPRFRGEPLSIELAVLVRIVQRIHGDVPVVPVSVPTQPEAAVLRAIGASLHEALEDVGATGTLVAAGDLSAGLHRTSPAYVVEGAEGWDAAIVSALTHGDLPALDRYGPHEAQRVASRGWAPIVTSTGAVAAGRLEPTHVGYHAPRGVGGVVARFVDREDAPGGRYEIAGGRTGVLEKPHRSGW